MTLPSPGVINLGRPPAGDRKRVKGWADCARDGDLRTLSFGAGHVAWHEWSSKQDAPAILLVHGGSGSWLHWLPCLPYLRNHFSVLAVDLPGFGASRSAKPSDFEAVVTGLRKVIEYNRGILSSVIAFSFGATVTGCALAQMTDPPRLHVVAPGGFGPTDIPPEAFKARTAARGPLERRAVDQHNFRIAMVATDHPAPAGGRMLYRCALKDARFDSRPHSFSRLFEERLADLPVASALWSGDDAFMRSDLNRRISLMSRYHPAAPQAIIQDAGHWLPGEAPALVAKWLRARA